MNPFTPQMMDAARGRIPADAVFTGASVFNPFTCTWDEGSLAVKNGIVLGLGDYTVRWSTTAPDSTSCRV